MSECACECATTGGGAGWFARLGSSLGPIPWPPLSPLLGPPLSPPLRPPLSPPLGRALGSSLGPILGSFQPSVTRSLQSLSPGTSVAHPVSRLVLSFGRCHPFGQSLSLVRSILPSFGRAGHSVVTSWIWPYPLDDAHPPLPPPPACPPPPQPPTFLPPRAIPSMSMAIRWRGSTSSSRFIRIVACDTTCAPPTVPSWRSGCESWGVRELGVERVRAHGAVAATRGPDAHSPEYWPREDTTRMWGVYQASGSRG